MEFPNLKDTGILIITWKRNSIAMLDVYYSFFGNKDNVKKIFSPYRVCPLGAHVDHQHGLVSGFAIDKGVELLFAPSEDSIIEMKSLTFQGEIVFDLNIPVVCKKNDWGDYIRGAVYALKKRFHLKYGIKGLIKGSLPVGGLSSSAAVLVAYVLALSDANDISLTPMEIIRITSEAEREYVGLNNGILDQACVVLSEKDNLLYLDTDTNDYQLLPKANDMSEFEVGIIFSGLTRSLISSDYNLRVSECKVAAWNMLAAQKQTLRTLDKTFLRDVPESYFHETKGDFPKRFRKRAEHFYSECGRVKQGVNAWQKGDIHAFGRLIFDSCDSSINKYECGSPELIAIYNIMRETDGIYGGRFSGAGFKGACICLLDPTKKDAIQQSVTAKYLEQFPQYGGSFEFHFCKTDSGARFV
ncbi:MAG: galactokinase [Dysgonamonadaceae bacterium]|jgi:galactokinase/galacturonokinase|nr:galactokinase [Dysgonamonadaceae bacterium]